MAAPKKLWVLAGGNGAGKTTFYDLYLAKHGITFVNADLIAKNIDSDRPEDLSDYSATVAAMIMGYNENEQRSETRNSEIPGLGL